MLTTEACKIRRINIYLSCAECFLLLISCGPWNHSGRWMAFQLGLPFYWWGNLARAGNWPKIPPAFPWWNQTWDRLRATVLTPLCGAAFNSTFFFPLAALGSWNIGPHGRWLQSRVGPSQLPFRGRCEEGRLWETQEPALHGVALEAAGPESSPASPLPQQHCVRAGQGQHYTVVPARQRAWAVTTMLSTLNWQKTWWGVWMPPSHSIPRGALPSFLNTS